MNKESNVKNILKLTIKNMNTLTDIYITTCD